MIIKKIGKIRDYINHPWKQTLLLQNKVKWNKLCSSMDVIEDTQIAIDSYTDLEEFDAYKGGYLFTYGLLQAFFLQQDATNHLSLALFNKKLEFKNDYQDLFKIRELRNDAIGHPTSRDNDKSFHYIAQHSVEKYRFTLASYFPNVSETEFKDVDLENLIRQQEENTSLILNKVIDLLKLEQDAHKKKFSGIKLIAQFPERFDYHIEKIQEEINYGDSLSKISFDSLYESFNSIKEGVNLRYSSYQALGGLTITIEAIEKLLNKFEQWFSNGKIIGNKDASVTLIALKNEFNDLFKIIKEIDEHFK